MPAIAPEKVQQGGAGAGSGGSGGNVGKLQMTAFLFGNNCILAKHRCTTQLAQ